LHCLVVNNNVSPLPAPSLAALHYSSRMNLQRTLMLKQQPMSHEFFTNFTAPASPC
jgi:hypothetical protein